MPWYAAPWQGKLAAIIFRDLVGKLDVGYRPIMRYRIDAKLFDLVRRDHG